MGLLTDPSAGKGRVTKLLLKYYNKLCILLYLSGLIWFCALAEPSMNANTYFSENALLPGLVKSQFHQDREAAWYHDELLDEMKKYDYSLPYPWLLAKFQQIGLDAYTHNFSLNSPLNKKEKYVGKNVYGILRSPRGSSTEALVLSVPYRTPTSIHPTTSPSIGIMLAFAKYASKEKFWAKDLIFLITEHEQLGIQAWLEAYHGVTCGNENILNHGDLMGRGGAIQAAINLEIHAEKIVQMDIKIEGLNGQLPNLDLFNLASKMCNKENLYQTFKNKGSTYVRDPIKQWWIYFKNLLSMMATQASGIPNGNHGLFHRFGIQALTLEGFEQTNARGASRVGLMGIGKILEGTFQSLNNLLERFHQSFFFYLLPSSEKYISIGLYIPSVCLIAGTLFIRACAKWLKLQYPNLDEDNSDSQLTAQPVLNTKMEKVLILFFLFHFCGLALSYLPQYLASMHNDDSTYNVKEVIFYAILLWCLALTVIPFFVPLRKSEDAMNVLNILAMLELGTALICVSMTNFSLGLFCAMVSVPFALCIGPTNCRYCSFIQKTVWLLVHPMTVVMILVAVNTYILFPSYEFRDLVSRIFQALKDTIIYSIVDSMIYGNWMYTAIASVFIPNWCCFWTVSFGKADRTKDIQKEEVKKKRVEDKEKKD